MSIVHKVCFIIGLFWISFATHAAPGDFDTTFGSGAGWVHTGFGSSSSVAHSVIQQADGKLVVAGDIYNNSVSRSTLGVARYNPDGSLDTTFNGSGFVTVDDGNFDKGMSVVQQADGKLVAAAYNFNGSYLITRFTSNGTLDTSFNGTGMVTTKIGTGTIYLVYQVIQQTDGKLVVTGLGDHEFVLLRYNADGSPDTTFNGTGRVNSASADYFYSVSQLANEKLLVAGAHFNGTDQDFLLAQYNPDGSLDSTFNGSGKVYTPYSSYDDWWKDLKIQVDGKYIVAGCSNKNISIGRYNPDGTLDANFGGTGLVTTSLGPYENCAQSVAIQADGKILVAGYQYNDTYGTSVNFVLARYNVDGTLDASFATNGLKIFTVGSGQAGANSIIQQRDGRIAIAGFSEGVSAAYGEFVVARFDSGQLDTDGDGWVDGLDKYPNNPHKWKLNQFYMDFNASGTSDILMRNSSTGAWQSFLMGYNANIASSAALAINASGDYVYQGTLDANGDGTADVLTRKTSTGEWVLWTIQNNAVTNTTVLNMTTDPNWSFQAVGDFNGDGTDDILIRHTSGYWFVYFLQNGQVFDWSGASVFMNADFVLQAVGDMTGDGIADALLRSQSSGAWYLYNGATGVTTIPALWRSSDWAFQTLADLNGDGIQDVVLRITNPASSYAGLWGGFIMNSSGNVASSYVLSSVWMNLGLQLAASGDYNGDGTGDLLLRNTSTNQYYLFTTNPPGSANPGLQTLTSIPVLNAAPWSVLRQ